MEDLFNLTDAGMDALVETAKAEKQEDVLAAVCVAIEEMPCIAGSVACFLAALIAADSSYLPLIGSVLSDTEGDDIAITSRMVYAAYLGASTPLAGIPPVADVFSGLALSSSIPTRFAERRVLDNDSDPATVFLEVFNCFAIVAKINFYRAEAIYRLRDFSHLRIIEALLVDESLAAIAMIIELCKTPGFLQALAARIAHFKRRVEIVALIFVAHYNARLVNEAQSQIPMQNEDDIRSLAGMFDDATEALALRIGNRFRLNTLLDRSYREPKITILSASEFVDQRFSSQEEFLTAFVAAGAPSPTHLLSYLEQYKDRFVLGDDDQQLLVRLLKEHHVNNEPYLDIVFAKLLKFGVVKHEYL